ncbi:MAG: AmmeMemoRadiSam system protein B [Sphaerochaeta sp.]
MKNNISIQYHNDIFYPSDKDEIEADISKIETNEEKFDVKGLLLPHAGYDYILPLLVRAFSSIEKNFDNIIIIGSPHQDILSKDSPYNIFLPSFDGCMTPYGPISFNTHIKEIAHEGMLKDSYFEEESEFELLYPIIKKFFSETPVIPICTEIFNSKKSKDLATFLNKIYSIEKNSLVIVTANMNSPKKGKVAYDDAMNFKQAIENGSYLLSPEYRKIVTSCGSGIFDAIKKTKVLKDKKWKILMVEREGEISQSIIKTTSKSHIVYHGLGILQ